MLRKKSTVIQSERCRVVKVRYFQNGKEPLQSLYSEKFPECTNFESYYLRNNGKFSQQTEQMWTIFNYSYVQWKQFPLCFESDRHANLRQCFLALFFTLAEVLYMFISATSCSWI